MPPVPGEVVAIAPGVHRLRMPPPFALGEALAHLHYPSAQGQLDRELGRDGINRFIRRGVVSGLS